MCYVQSCAGRSALALFYAWRTFNVCHAFTLALAFVLRKVIRQNRVNEAAYVRFCQRRSGTRLRDSEYVVHGVGVGAAVVVENVNNVLRRECGECVRGHGCVRSVIPPDTV